MVEGSRAKYRHGRVQYSQVEPSGAMVECTTVPSRAKVECSRVKYSQVDPW